MFIPGIGNVAPAPMRPVSMVPGPTPPGTGGSATPALSGGSVTPALPGWVLVDVASVPDAVAAAAYRLAMSSHPYGTANQIVTYAGRQYLLRTRTVPSTVVPAYDPTSGAGEMGFSGAPAVSARPGSVAVPAAVTFIYVIRGTTGVSSVQGASLAAAR